jgi:hypothetical protein
VKKKILIGLGFCLGGGILLIGAFLFLLSWQLKHRLPRKGWYQAKLKLTTEVDGKNPCPLYLNMKERSVRFQILKRGGMWANLLEDGSGWFLKDEHGNVFEGLDDGSNGINFNQGIESYFLSYTTGPSTSCFYFPDQHEFNSDSCLTRYVGEALPVAQAN